ncbi:RlpA-like double-psi beta-barrel-protein domain-containing protein-containing protein [Geopyxis carbonaria]|nr:RlpA-like double-psi beta-barrel-protein domain-containing protein-containing protein [Geopyxis carbonaria]
MLKGFLTILLHRTDSSSATATGASSSSAAQPGQSSGSATNAPSTSSASAPSSSTSQPSSSSPGPASSSASSSSSSSSSKPSSSSSSSSGSSSSGGGGGGEEFEGEATFYAPGLGSCGTDATDADYVAALSKVLFDATGATNSNANPYCGRKALVKAAGGGGVTITIVDRCPVCKQYDLDLSPAAYNVLGDADAGRIPIKWSWLD